eukprot:scaffold7067_cov245-Pinguiococcus_pyrenoidosus.AAC.5
MGRGYEDDFNSFHDHDHWPGFAIMAMRIGFAVMCWVGSSRTLADDRLNPGAKKLLTIFQYVLGARGERHCVASVAKAISCLSATLALPNSFVCLFLLVQIRERRLVPRFPTDSVPRGDLREYLLAALRGCYLLQRGADRSDDDAAVRISGEATQKRTVR